MSNKVEGSGLVPKLRFPEFREAGAWIAMKLNEACDVNPENSALPEEFAYIDLESVEAGELKARKIISRDEAPSRAQRLLHYGDVIFQIVRPYQRNNFHFRIDDDVHYVASTGYAQLRANESADFLFQAVHTDDFVGRVIAKCTGSSYPAINSSDLADISIAIPSSAEQQKIADCLASLDELLTLEAQKLDTLKTHKKGLMQQFFPAESETLPKLRFPEFRDTGEWEELPIEEKIDLLSGYPFDGADITEDMSGIPLMRGINITEGFVRHSWDIDRFFLDDAKKLEKYRLRIDDLVIGMDGSKVGKNSALISEIDVDALLVQRVARLRVKGEASIQYIFQQINSSKFHAYVDRINTSSGIPHISAKQINDFKICFPSVAEQQKIADCLGSLDDLITAQTQKLVALKIHKKGLMQQLFPVQDEAAA